MTEKTIPLKNIQPNPWNPNEMTEDEFTELKKEIQHLGKLPKKIILRKLGDVYQIVDGEHSYRALKELEFQELPEGWYEIIEIDGIEARRQTYKRNLGGKNNPAKLGLMFEQVIKESDISIRKLAEQWEISEGMIRNYLKYAEVAKLRNDYANIAKLTTEQIRIYASIAEYAKPIADYWLNMGGIKDALVVLDEDIPFDKANYDVMATFQKLSIRIMERGYNKVIPIRNKQYYMPDDSSLKKSKDYYIAKFKENFNRALNLSTMVEQMETYFIWDKEVTQYTVPQNSDQDLR